MNASSLAGPNTARGRFAGKVALIVGAGAVGPGWGIGKATSVLLAREGATVFAADVNLPAAQETVGLIEAEQGKATAHSADVSSAADMEAMVERCIALHGRIDVLMNNVGIGEVGGPVELSEQSWDRISAVNNKGLFLACKYVLPHMERAGSGAIVTVSSVAAQRYPGYPHLAYGTTKAAAIQFTRMVALQYAKKGIRANTVVPGLMNTPRIAQTVAKAISSKGLEDALRVRDQQCPMGYMGDAWDVAQATAFLASDEARYITGTELVVDGGLTCKYA